MAITLIIALTLSLALAAEPIAPEAADAQPYYQTVTASRNGIGKVYYGREISQVMGHRGAGWLERSSREQEERTDLLLQNLSLKATDHVADLGAGTGYFTFPIARQVISGKVLAIDIAPEMLNIIAQRKKAEDIENIDTVLATTTRPNIPAGSVDVVLMVDAYHEFSHPYEVMAAVVEGLKPGGRVILVEYRGEDNNVPIKRLHKMTEQQSKKEMTAVGLQWLRTDSYLPQQHVMTFIKP